MNSLFLSRNCSNQNLVHARKPVKDVGIERRGLPGARAFSLKTSRQTARSNMALADSCANSVNSHAKRKRMLLSLFVVVDVMQSRLRNMACVPEFIGN
jgi:hypothetical protein